MMKRLIAALFLCVLSVPAAVQTPEQYFGFRIGSDKKLARWDKIVEYMQDITGGTDRVKFRNLGPTTNGNPFIMLEISSAENLRNLDKLKALERKLYFQGGAPTDAERDEIFRTGKSVVFITNNIHSTEIGASQMVLELVHRLATDDSAATKKILDNVILLLVPSLNPDGQIMVTDWYNKTLGTPSEASPLPFLYHNYTGHDNNRDMYLFSQKESQMAAQILWHEWFPTIWLDEHHGARAVRAFYPCRPPTDQPERRPAHLPAERRLRQCRPPPGSRGQNGHHLPTYTNSAGRDGVGRWWHNQVGMLTEVASARIRHRENSRPTSGAGGGSASHGARGAATGRGRRQRLRIRAPPQLNALTIPSRRATSACTEYLARG